MTGIPRHDCGTLLVCDPGFTPASDTQYLCPPCFESLDRQDFAHEQQAKRWVSLGESWQLPSVLHPDIVTGETILIANTFEVRRHDAC